MSRVRLIHGDALEMLETLDGESFDACLCDPPYGLKFMGRRWDHGVPSSEVWAEVLRCLRPGASLMAFGGTRTYHRLAVAVEDAGFEIRDSVLVPGVVWSMGSGFPKSLDVSKAIDRAAGVERERVRVPAEAARNPKSVRGGHGIDGGDRPWMREARERGYHEMDGGTPATPEAARWEGYGTAVKPAHEPVVWAMKPVDGTFARNALEHGVAGVNVDAGRVGDGISRETTTGGMSRKGAPIFGKFDRDEVEPFTTTQGRFPSNLVFLHLPGCRREGTKRVKSGNSLQPSDSTGAVYPRRQIEVGPHYADPDGVEEVPAWQCVEGCPVLAMDRASGESEQRPQTIRRGERSKYQNYGGYPNQEGTTYEVPGDSGTASRFFKQVSWEPGEFERTLLYYAKAPTTERMVDGERLLHPTMKPLALATYLARMLLPPPREDGQPRRLLVPFSGVGSEVIGALRAGWDEVVGIELDADCEGWIEKSARRIEADAPLFNEVEIEYPSRDPNHPALEAARREAGE